MWDRSKEIITCTRANIYQVHLILTAWNRRGQLHCWPVILHKRSNYYFTMISRLFTVPYFSVRSEMSIVESDGPPSWSRDVSETGESTKCPWVGVVEGTADEKNIFSAPSLHAFNPITPTHRHFVLSPVSLASRDQDGGQSDSTIDIYDLTEK